MNANFKKLALFVATTAALGMSADLRAEENSAADTTAPFGTTFSVPVRVDFLVRIPSFLFFQVGTAGAVVDQVVFSPTVAEVEGSTAVTGVAALGVTLRSNAGPVTITATNSGTTGLANGAGDFINYSTITAGVTGANTDLVPPTLTNAGGTTSVIPVTSPKVTNKTATWTYTYTPTGIPPAGEYGGSANGGRVTYTASTV